MAIAATSSPSTVPRKYSNIIGWLGHPPGSRGMREASKVSGSRTRVATCQPQPSPLLLGAPQSLLLTHRDVIGEHVGLVCRVQRPGQGGQGSRFGGACWAKWHSSRTLALST